MATKVLPYKLGSKGARKLANALDVWQVRNISNIRPTDRIICWGYSGQLPPCRVVNQPASVAIAKHKTRTFERLFERGVNTLEFSTSREQARQWQRAGRTIVCRATASGTGGEGITIVDNNSVDIPSNPLYTIYVKKKAEYRVHVAFGRVINVTQKIKPNGVTISGDTRIRTHRTGYIFVRPTTRVPQDVEAQAVRAVAALGLDFGGVDVIYNEAANAAYILEINTAPGLDGDTTVEAYREAFQNAGRR